MLQLRTVGLIYIKFGVFLLTIVKNIQHVDFHYIPVFNLFEKKKIHKAVYMLRQLTLLLFLKCPCINEDCWISGRSTNNCFNIYL